METPGPDAESARPGLELRLLGPLRLLRAGVVLQLPPSRKLRALIAYLTLATRPVPRERLCALLWQVPDDPRGELRWCLSKLRGLLDEPGRSRVRASEDGIALDLADCRVDASRLLVAAKAGFDGLDDADLSLLAETVGGDFLEGTELSNTVEFEHWLAGRRSAFRTLHIALLGEMARRAPAGTAEALSATGKWVEAAPFDAAAHARFLTELHARRMIDDCAGHLERTKRSFDAEGFDFTPVASAWRKLKGEPAATVREPARSDALDKPVRPPRPSVAIMPFQEAGTGSPGGSDLGHALTHDVISRLARLRGLFVIARGSVFALAREQLGHREIGERLGVRYVVTGVLERQDDTVAASVEIAEAVSGHIVWSDRFETYSSARLAILDEIGDGIVSAIAAEIETAERTRAVLKPPESLDAWEAYHRGLWHMYRFTAEENEHAAAFFSLSARLDPTFSRAQTGLSFTHWQRAFQRWGERDAQARQAIACATQSLLIDEQNPAAHWSMGRALWLVGDQAGAVSALERSVALSPNFALGHYALSFVHCQGGDPLAALSASDHSRLLSPHDPLLFGMLGTRAMALVRLGALAEAAEWSLRAAACPNAHVHIVGLAAHCLAFSGRMEEARGHAARLRLLQPDYTVDDLLSTFRFEAETQLRYRKAARTIGLSA